jgi:hypothetical protein
MTPIFINKQVFLESRRSSSRMLGLLSVSYPRESRQAAFEKAVSVAIAE